MPIKIIITCGVIAIIMLSVARADVTNLQSYVGVPSTYTTTDTLLLSPAESDTSVWYTPAAEAMSIVVPFTLVSDTTIVQIDQSPNNLYFSTAFIDTILAAAVEGEHYRLRYLDTYPYTRIILTAVDSSAVLPRNFHVTAP